MQAPYVHEGSHTFCIMSRSTPVAEGGRYGLCVHCLSGVQALSLPIASTVRHAHDDMGTWPNSRRCAPAPPPGSYVARSGEVLQEAAPTPTCVLLRVHRTGYLRFRTDATGRQGHACAMHTG